MCSTNSPSQHALSMNSERKPKSVPKSILKSRSKIDSRNSALIEDNALGSKGQNQLVAIATIPHSCSPPETTDEGDEQNKLTMECQDISQKHIKMPKQPRIARIFGKGSRKKVRKSRKVPKDAKSLETNASSEKSSMHGTGRSIHTISTIPIGNLSILGNHNSKVANPIDINVGNKNAPSVFGYRLESVRSGIPSFLPAPTTGTTSEPLLTSRSTPEPQTPSLAVSGRGIPAARNGLGGNVSFDSKSHNQSAKGEDALTEKSLRIKRILGMNSDALTEKSMRIKRILGKKSKRDHQGGNNLQKMVRKIKEKKLMTQKPSNAVKGAYAGSLDQSPTRSSILAESNDERQLLQNMWPSTRPSKSWKVEDEKRMLKAMNKVVKRRLEAIEMLEKEPALDNPGCFGFNVFRDCSCTG
jgi:hypothetical protein